MDNQKKRAVGSIKVSADVIMKIAETAACEIDGVVSEGGRLAVLGAKSKFFGAVRAHLLGETASLKLEVIVLEGYNAVNVAESVQRSVKSAIQNMTGFTVTKVDVDIVGIRFMNGNAPARNNTEESSSGREE